MSASDATYPAPGQQFIDAHNTLVDMARWANREDTLTLRAAMAICLRRAEEARVHSESMRAKIAALEGKEETIDLTAAFARQSPADEPELERARRMV